MTLVSNGAMVDLGHWPVEGTLEVTQALHPNDHLMRERLNAEGFAFGLDGLSRGPGKRGERAIRSEPTGYSNQSYIGDMATIMLESIKAKSDVMAQGGYPPDTTLILNCHFPTVFLPDEWDAAVKLVRDGLPAHGFVRIFATASPSAPGYSVIL